MDTWKNQLFSGTIWRFSGAAAGFYVPEQFPEHRFPKIQILTIAELFAGKKLEYPKWGPPSTFKKAARRRKGPSDEERQGGIAVICGWL